MAQQNIAIIFLILMTGLTSSFALAAEEVLNKKNIPKEGPAVLDFEADIIEGERKNPQLFLQLGSETPDLSAVLFLRNDFNDFHDVETKRKPHYQTRRQSGKK